MTGPTPGAGPALAPYAQPGAPARPRRTPPAAPGGPRGCRVAPPDPRSRPIRPSTQPPPGSGTPETGAPGAPGAPERLAKLETAVRAALRLRRMIEDVAPVSRMLLVPRTEVARFDDVMNELKGEQK